MDRKPFIYLVDDEPAHAMLLTYHIEKLGYEVIHYENSIDFLHAIPADLEFLMVSDQLADMTVDELCQVVRKKLDKPIRLIITTTGISSQPCECSSFTSFLHKPFSITDLKERLYNTFKQHSLT